MKSPLIAMTVASALLLATSGEPIKVNLQRRHLAKSSKRHFGGNYSHNQSQSEPSHILGDYVVDLLNDHEIGYMGPIYVGSNREFGSLLYDTGSAALPVNTPQCDTCTSQVYDPEASSTSQFVRNGQLNYGKGHYEGAYYLDTVSFDNGVTPLTNYEVFAVTYQEDSEGLDGILGLSPDSKFVTAMKEQGYIDTAIAGFHVDSINEESNIIFGGFDDSLFLQDPVFFPLLHPVLNTNWWQVAISEAAYNGQSFLNSGTSAIFDTGTSLVMFSFTDLQRLANFLKEDNDSFNCAAGTCYAFGHCDNIAPTLSPITFQFGTSDVFHITPDEYLLNGSDLGVDLPVCYVGLAGSPGNDLYIIGDSFLRSHYQIYDYENLQVGIARTKGNHSPLFLK